MKIYVDETYYGNNLEQTSRNRYSEWTAKDDSGMKHLKNMIDCFRKANITAELKEKVTDKSLVAVYKIPKIKNLY